MLKKSVDFVSFFPNAFVDKHFISFGVVTGIAECSLLELSFESDLEIVMNTLRCVMRLHILERSGWRTTVHSKKSKIS